MDPAVAAGILPASNNFHDGLGERRRTSDANGDTIELLCLRRDLTAIPSFEFALRERTSRLATFRHPSYGRVRSVDRLNDSASTLAVASDFTRGVRLSQLLMPTDRRPITIDINAALHLIRQLVSAVAILHEDARDVAHGAIGPERVIVTANARVIIGEYVLGAALEQLRFSHERYWNELRIAAAPSASLPRFDQRTDIMQIGIVALSLVLGRLLTADEYPDQLGDVLASAWGISAQGGLEPLPPGVRAWLSRALQLDARHSFESAIDARAELDKVLSGEEEEEDYLRDAAERTPEPQQPPAAVVIASESATVMPEADFTPFESEPLPAAVASQPMPVAVVEPIPVSVAPEPIPVAVVPDPMKIVVTPKPTTVLDAHVHALDAFFSEETPVAVMPEPKPVIAAPEPKAAMAPPETKPLPVAPVTAPRAFSAAVPAAVAPKPTFSAVIDAGADDEFGVAAKGQPYMTKPARSGQRWARLGLAAAVLVSVSMAGMLAVRRYSATPVNVASTGTLNVTSNPPGALVVVDNESRGATPLTLTLAPGQHLVELRGNGEPRSIPVTITAGAQTSQYIELPSETAPVGAGQLHIRTEPAGARVTVDGVARGKAPLLIEGLASGEHTVVLESDFGTVKHTVNVQAATTASLVVPLTAGEGAALSGWVSLSTPVEVQIFEHGRLLGTNQSERLMVAAGRHELELVNEPLGYRAVTVVQVPPGKVQPIRIEWPKGSVALNAVPWAEVWINGEKLGETPIGNLSLPIGVHEVVFRHPDFGERRNPVSVSLKSPARVSVDMRKQP